MEQEHMFARIQRLEARLHRMAIAGTLLILALLGVGALAWKRVARPDVLRLRTLIIVDERGVERVRLGGQLPDAVIHGRRVPRGEQAAGMLLYDDTGQERGGYVTFSPSGNVALTLDTRQGQVALFAAGPSGGAVARLWHASGADWIEMRSDETGTRLTVGRSHAVVVQMPPLTETEAAAFCSALQAEWRQKKSALPVATVLQACTQRMPETVCRTCLGVH